MTLSMHPSTLLISRELPTLQYLYTPITLMRATWEAPCQHIADWDVQQVLTSRNFFLEAGETTLTVWQKTTSSPASRHDDSPQGQV